MTNRKAKDLRSAWLLPAAMLSLLAIGGCNDCAIGAPPFINVEVRDSITGLPAADGAVGLVRRGDFLDTLRLLVSAPSDSTSTLILVSAPLQAGEYAVSVTKSGYAPWVATRVVLENESCAINSVVLQARLQPLP
jgi:hypothetical protein